MVAPLGVCRIVSMTFRSIRNQPFLRWGSLKKGPLGASQLAGRGRAKRVGMASADAWRAASASVVMADAGTVPLSPRLSATHRATASINDLVTNAPL